MALFKRFLGLRVAAVAVVSALVVVGLEAPASAGSPTISSFSPTSGPPSSRPRRSGPPCPS